MKRGVTVLMLSAAMLSLPVMAQPAQETNKQEMREGQEQHPVIRRAIRQLENVKMELNKEAARDFDGHRAQAVKSVDEAIEHLKQALASDKH